MPRRSAPDRRALDEWLDALAEKARGALRELCAGIEPRIASYMTHALGDPHDAEEATQDVMVRVLASLPRYRPRGAHFMSWALAIAHNRAIDVRHDRARSLSTDPAELAEDASRERPSPDSEPRPPRDEHSVLRELIAPLSPLHREVITLIYELDMSPEQVGTALGRSADSVRQEHARARKKLLEIVEGERRRLFER